MSYKSSQQRMSNNEIVEKNSVFALSAINIKEEHTNNVNILESNPEGVALIDYESIPNKKGTIPFVSKNGKVLNPKPISNSIKKKRRNFRLRKSILPKAPSNILNDIVRSVNYTFDETKMLMPTHMGSRTMHLFTAKCVIGEETFNGMGPSKQFAKDACAENAIQAIVVKKAKSSQCKIQSDADGNPLEPNQMEDETPWAQLASLALFKLFKDWQAQGKTVPSNLWQGRDAMDKAAKKIPKIPTNRHPVQLLNELQRGVNFNLVSEVGESPTLRFTIGVDIDGKSFIGQGRTKKEAKKNCAVVALKHVYNITCNLNT